MEQKRCLNCNKLFGPIKRPDGKTEYPCVFKKKRFCSVTCASIHTQAKRKVEIDQSQASTKGAISG